MKVKDIDGLEINIPDLDRAIEMAEFFKDAEHSPPHPIDKERQAYWKDMYEKLMAIKNKENENVQTKRK